MKTSKIFLANKYGVSLSSTIGELVEFIDYMQRSYTRQGFFALAEETKQDRELLSDFDLFETIYEY